MAITNSDKRFILHAFKAIALSRLQLKDFDEYKKYEDEIISDLSEDIKLALMKGNNNGETDGTRQTNKEDKSRTQR